MIDARQYVGIQYRKHGRCKRTGLDCWGLIWLVYQEQLGLQIPDYANEYVNAEDPVEISKLVTSRVCEWLRVDKPVAGNVVLFKLCGSPCHAGIMLDRKRFLHASQPLGVTVEQVTCNRWNRRIEGYYARTNASK